jgi:hypothetical protein
MSLNEEAISLDGYWTVTVEVFQLDISDFPVNSMDATMVAVNFLEATAGL